MPVVANTANFKELEDLQDKPGSFNSVLPKPFWREQIVSIVQKLIGIPSDPK